MIFQTLKAKRDFDFVYKNAKRVYAKNFVLYILKRSDERFFLGLSVSKKVGIACKRNLIKRRFRGLCIAHARGLGGLSLVFVPKQGILEMSYRDLEQDFLKCLGFFNKQRGQAV